MTSRFDLSIATRVARKSQLGCALKQRIAALDPEEDHEEVALARLTPEVLYSDPIAVHARLSDRFRVRWPCPASPASSTGVAAAPTCAIPRARTDDTLGLFGAFLKWGPSSSEGRLIFASALIKNVVEARRHQQAPLAD